MDRLRAAAVGAPAWLREWVNKTTREEGPPTPGGTVGGSVTPNHPR